MLAPLDRLQSHFLKEIGLTTETAFLEHNLLPLGTRRDISMLGLIYKCAHKIAHADLQLLFPPMDTTGHGHNTRLQSTQHPLQLKEERPGTKHGLLRRSVFGLTRVWNRLPGDAVMAATVTKLQVFLTELVRTSCHRFDRDWVDLLSPRPILLRGSGYFQQLQLRMYHNE